MSLVPAIRLCHIILCHRQKFVMSPVSQASLALCTEPHCNKSKGIKSSTSSTAIQLLQSLPSFYRALYLLGGIVLPPPPLLCASFYIALPPSRQNPQMLSFVPLFPHHICDQLHLNYMSHYFRKRELTFITDLERRWKKSLPQLLSFWSGISCLRKVWIQD